MQYHTISYNIIFKIQIRLLKLVFNNYCQGRWSEYIKYYLALQLSDMMGYFQNPFYEVVMIYHCIKCLITSPIYGIRSYEPAFGGVLLMVP